MSFIISFGKVSFPVELTECLWVGSRLWSAFPGTLVCRRLWRHGTVHVGLHHVMLRCAHHRISCWWWWRRGCQEQLVVVCRTVDALTDLNAANSHVAITFNPKIKKKIYALSWTCLCTQCRLLVWIYPRVSKYATENRTSCSSSFSSTSSSSFSFTSSSFSSFSFFLKMRLQT